jgi:hypothetical protein
LLLLLLLLLLRGVSLSVLLLVVLLTLLLLLLLLLLAQLMLKLRGSTDTDWGERVEVLHPTLNTALRHMLRAVCFRHFHGTMAQRGVGPELWPCAGDVHTNAPSN